MDLLNTALALDDPNFSRRVRAACILHAIDNVAAYYADRATRPKLYYYAMHVLMFPDTVDPSMKAFVAGDGVVSAAVKVNPISTADVPDSEIIRVVSDKWNEVSIKYNSDPSEINRVTSAGTTP